VPGFRRSIPLGKKTHGSQHTPSPSPSPSPSPAETVFRGTLTNELEEEEGGIDEKQDLDPERSGGHRETDAVVVVVVGGSF
jgi:hypothetical protein